MSGSAVFASPFEAKRVRKFTQPFLIGLVLFTLISLPYIQAVRMVGTDHVFGGFLFNPIDGNTYLAKMYQGWRGEWLFKLPYTAEAGHGAYLFLFYILLGHLARWLDLPLIVIFHVARLAAVAFMLWGLYRFLTKIFADTNWRTLAFFVTAIGSGIGWLLLPLGVFTSDFWVAETFPFLSAFANPHFPLGLGLLLFLLSFPVGENHHPSRTALVSGICAFCLAIVMPFGAVLAISILSVVVIWEYLLNIRRGEKLYQSFLKINPDLKAGLLAIIITATPVLIYQIWAINFDPLLRGWNIQNLTPSPPIWDLFISLSPMLAFALFGVLTSYRRNRFIDRLLIAWLVTDLVLLYLPVGLQRRFMFGLFIPVSILGIIGLQSIASQSARWGRVIVVLTLVACLPTTILVLLTAQHGVLTFDPMLYLSKGEASALDWVEANTPGNALILSSAEIGLFIPAHTGRRVIYGHPFETVQAEEQKEKLDHFFRSLKEGVVDPARSGIGTVDYIFFGPREQQESGVYKIDNTHLLYSDQGVNIYQAPGLSNSISGK